MSSSCRKIDPYRPFLRERWEAGVHNARKLLDEIRVRGYDGGYSQLKLAVTPWREEGRARLRALRNRPW
jgi:hypothetical protein